MNIIQIIQRPQLRGAEIFAAQLSEELRKIGFNVTIICLFKGDKQLPFFGKIIYLNRPENRRMIDGKGWKQLAKVIKEEKADIVQANAADTLKYAVFSKLLFSWNQPIVFRNASTISLYIKSFFSKQWNAFLFKHTTHVVSVSENSRKDFVELFPAFQKRSCVIPIGVNKQELGAKVCWESPTIIHVGGFTYEKNHAGLLDIFELVRNKFPQVKLYLVGDGPLRNQVEQDVKDRELHDCVVFAGAQKNAINLIQKGHCLVLPSIIEGLPAVILEAFYTKTPVVAFNVGGIKEIVDDDSGWLIEKNNNNEFAGAIENVLMKTDKVDKRIANAFHKVSLEYTNDIIAKKFANLYQTFS